MLKKKIKIVGYLLFLFFTFGCTNSDVIKENSYKGLGILCYFEEDNGNYYDMIFIPFHFKLNIEDPSDISKQKILQNKESIIFEKGLGFGTFSNNDIFDKVFLNSQPCETKKYCFVYVDFVENKQKEIKKWSYDKKELSLRICIDDEIKVVKYYHTQNAARNLIKINTLKLIK